MKVDLVGKFEGNDTELCLTSVYSKESTAYRGEFLLAAYDDPGSARIDCCEQVGMVCKDLNVAVIGANQQALDHTVEGYAVGGNDLYMKLLHSLSSLDGLCLLNSLINSANE